MSLLPHVCVLANDIDRVSTFLVDSFQCKLPDVVEKPIRHRVIRISEESSVMVVHKSGCDERAIASVGLLGVHHLFIAVNDVAAIQLRATNAGATVTQSDVDEKGGSICILEGPERIYFHIVSREKQATINTHELALSTVWSRLEQSDIKATGPQGQGSPQTAAASAQKSTSQRTVQSNLPRRPIIPTMDVQLLSNNSKGFIQFPPNVREAIPFETELFKGVALLICRTTPPDDFYKGFFQGNKRVFELQVQGQFKRMPNGEIYVGGEASNKMELGFVMRSVCKAVCNFACSIINDLHYSFGDTQNKDEYEIPHMAAPLFTTMDKIVVSLPGEKPPAMGTPFPEDPDYRKKRLKFRSIEEAKLDLRNVYSFSVNTNNIDFCSWQVVGIPMVRPMDLRSFFGDSTLRLVTYEITKTVLQKFPNKHPVNYLNYLLNVKITGLDPDKAVDLALDVDDTDVSDAEAPSPRRHTNKTTSDLETSPHILAALERSASENSSSKPSNTTTNDKNDSLCRRQAQASSTTEIVDDDDEDDYDGDGDGLGEDESPSNSRPKRRERKEQQLVAQLQAGGGRGRGARVGSLSDDESDNGIDEDDEEEGDLEVDGFSFSSSQPRRNDIKAKLAAGGKNVSRWFKRKVNELNPNPHELPQEHDQDLVLPDYEMESSGDLRYCPAIIEVADTRPVRRDLRKKFFVLHWMEQKTGPDGPHGELVPRLRTYNEITRAIPKTGSTPNKTYKSKKYSSDENRRWEIIESYKTVLVKGTAQQQGQLRSLLSSPNETDNTFLGFFSMQPVVKAMTAATEKRFEGTVALATSRRHWTEQFMQITKSEVLLRKHPDALRVSLRIPFKSVIAVRPMRDEEVPIPGFSFFQIETFGRVYYFLVRSSRQRSDWINALTSQLPLAIMNEPRSRAEEVAHLTEIGGFFMARPPCWRFDKRRLFNFRRIVFTPAGLPSELRDLTPCALAESVLSFALRLTQTQASKETNSLVSTSEIALWVDFLDQISALQIIDISTLSELERATFFLNIYHTMVIHGSLVIGPPPSWSSWQYFFSTLNYVICFDVVSIAEMEHGLLRAAMSRPSTMISKIPAPLTLFPGLALTQRDFRLNFCINNGSISFLNYVPIYYVDTLDRQLDEMTSRLLYETVEVDVQRRTITLPKSCSWYLADFGARRGGTTVVPLDCLRALVHYFKPEDKEVVLQMLLESSAPNIRFKNFNFRCRHLQPMQAAYIYGASSSSASSIEIENRSPGGSDSMAIL